MNLSEISGAIGQCVGYSEVNAPEHITGCKFIKPFNTRLHAKSGVISHLY